MHLRACLIFACTFLVLVPDARGQAAIIGRVTDTETGSALADAHVFIATSMNGSASNADGRYELTGVPLGAHRIYVSILGYEPQALDVFIRTGGYHTFDFQLVPVVIELDEIEVSARRNERWKRRLDKFTRLFIGETPNAALTKIINPEVLDFTERMGRFTARASGTLVIENRALGYRLRYYLKEFEAVPNRVRWDGEPLFEEIPPSSPEETATWEENRRAAFNGSFRHFMLALLAGRSEEEGFRIYQRPASSAGLGGAPTPGGNRFPLDPSTLLHPGNDEQERTLDFHGFLEMVYTRELEDPSYLDWRGRRGRPKYPTSMLLLDKGPTTVDLKGDTLDPYGVTFFGYLAFERVADDVPKEYRPR